MLPELPRIAKTSISEIGSLSGRDRAAAATVDALQRGPTAVHGALGSPIEVDSNAEKE